MAGCLLRPSRYGLPAQGLQVPGKRGPARGKELLQRDMRGARDPGAPRRRLPLWAPGVRRRLILSRRTPRSSGPLPNGSGLVPGLLEVHGEVSLPSLLLPRRAQEAHVRAVHQKTPGRGIAPGFGRFEPKPLPLRQAAVQDGNAKELSASLRVLTIHALEGRSISEPRRLEVGSHARGNEQRRCHEAPPAAGMG